MEYRHTSCMEIRNTRHGNKECLWMEAYLKGDLRVGEVVRFKVMLDDNFGDPGNCQMKLILIKFLMFCVSFSQFLTIASSEITSYLVTDYVMKNIQNLNLFQQTRQIFSTKRNAKFILKIKIDLYQPKIFVYNRCKYYN